MWDSIKKLVSIAIVLTLVSTYTTLYTMKAHTIAAHIYEDAEGKNWWRTTSSGSLFPWPKEPGMLQALSKINEIDLFLYRYLIKPWILVGLSVLMCVGTGLSIFNVIKAQTRLT